MEHAGGNMQVQACGREYAGVSMQVRTCRKQKRERQRVQGGPGPGPRGRGRRGPRCPKRGGWGGHKEGRAKEPNHRKETK